MLDEANPYKQAKQIHWGHFESVETFDLPLLRMLAAVNGAAVVALVSWLQATLGPNASDANVAIKGWMFAALLFAGLGVVAAPFMNLVRLFGNRAAVELKSLDMTIDLLEETPPETRYGDDFPGILEKRVDQTDVYYSSHRTYEPSIWVTDSMKVESALKLHKRLWYGLVGIAYVCILGTVVCVTSGLYTTLF